MRVRVWMMEVGDEKPLHGKYFEKMQQRSNDARLPHQRVSTFKDPSFFAHQAH